MFSHIFIISTEIQKEQEVIFLFVQSFDSVRYVCEEFRAFV